MQKPSIKVLLMSICISSFLFIAFFLRRHVDGAESSFNVVTVMPSSRQPSDVSHGPRNTEIHPQCWWSSQSIQHLWVVPQTSSFQSWMTTLLSVCQPPQWTKDCSQQCTKRWHSSTQHPKWCKELETERNVELHRVSAEKLSLQSVPIV